MNDEEINKILVAIPENKFDEQEAKIKSQFWPKLRSYASSIPFAEDATAAYYCATDKRTPLKVRGTLVAALAYFIVPIDLVPDILAIVGFTDDLAVLTAAITLVQSHVTQEHREKAKTALSTDKGDMHN